MLFVIILYIKNKKLKFNIVKVTVLYTSILAVACAIQTVTSVASFSVSIAYTLDCCAALLRGSGPYWDIFFGSR